MLPWPNLKLSGRMSTTIDGKAGRFEMDEMEIYGTFCNSFNTQLKNAQKLLLHHHLNT